MLSSRFSLDRSLLKAVALPLFASVVCLPGAELRFNRDVRPILSDKCWVCHGPDAVAKKIPLRLDSEAAAKADVNGRTPIVAGDPDKSTVMQRISAAKAGQRMPPVYSELKLTEREIATIREWISQGAKWEKHWAYIPPVRSELPKVGNQGWTKNEIDYFVLEQLERKGLKPSAEASPEKLLRRVSLDLTGLPPTAAEMDAFAADRSPGAYEKVVDRLLASPRYGERMAARWLDAARYADSNGYQFDGERQMWRWRDWVIQAFNRNQPYDRFMVEQIAGDLLPKATLDQRIATGFNRNHRINTEDGIIPEEYAVEYVVDRVETTSTVFLGVTLGCARCHNHKYDPFTQREFYQMFAYFNNVPELGRGMKYGNSPPILPAPTAEQQRVADELNKKIAAARGAVSDEGLTQWVASKAHEDKSYWSPSVGLNAAWTFDESGTTVPTRAGRIGRAGVFDGSKIVESDKAGSFDIEDPFTLSGWVYSDTVPHGSIMSRMIERPQGKGYGVHANEGRIHVNLTSNYDDDAIRIETEAALAAKRWYHIAVTYTGSRMAEGIVIYVDGAPVKTKVLLDSLYRPFRNAGRPFRQPFRIGSGWGKEKRFRGAIDDVRLYDRLLGVDEIESLATGEPVGRIARKAEAGRSGAEQRILRWHYLEHGAPENVRESWQRLTRLEREAELLSRTFPTVMVMAESPAKKKTHMLLRGAYDKPGEVVEPDVPEVLHRVPDGAPRNRLGLAQWLADPSNPLTSRVAVNRFWQMYFGAGLVKTTEDFGVQGDWPSHPELLDWLATEFVRSGWDIKAMQKRIVMSATYRQSSTGTPEQIQADPENRLLSRGPRHRLPSEMVRDAALHAAGLLVERVGGPSVRPYQPEGLWKDQSMQDMDYVQSKGSDLYRRSMYTFWKRTIPPPMMINFDAANREACVVRESRTNTPLQALNLMNDVTFVEAARFIGQRMIREGGNEAGSRLSFGFGLLTGRQPTAKELAVLAGNLDFHRRYFDSQPERAASLLAQGETRTEAAIAGPELAAYASVASLMLNLDEAITKE